MNAGKAGVPSMMQSAAQAGMEGVINAGMCPSQAYTGFPDIVISYANRPNDTSSLNWNLLVRSFVPFAG